MTTRTIHVALEGDAPHETTFGQFVADNELSDKEAVAVAISLLDTGEYVGGGGAAPVYIILLGGLRPSH